MVHESTTLELTVSATSAACELTVLMPCLNEAETLATCIRKAQAFLADHGVAGEVLIADNGSTDGSQAIAEALGARVVHVPIRGYGAALLAGTEAARGRYVVMGDADDSYDFTALMPFLARLRAGDELVMGNRFQGGIAPGAMPLHHKYLGNPVLTGIGRLLFRSPCGDFHCGLRGFDKAAVEALGLRTLGMEFASEMVVRATLHGLRIGEVPTTLKKDGRSRPPHLRSWRDGWRHLRFLLMYSPRWLFLYPGLALIAMGLLLTALVLPGPFRLGTAVLDVHTLLVAAAATLVGTQTVTFAWLTKVFAINEGLLPPDEQFESIKRLLTLEVFVAAGASLALTGAAALVAGFAIWQAKHFGALDYQAMMRLIVPAVMAVSLGFQLGITGFLSSILDLKVRRD
ncbi:MAG: glycosyltransferase family 2 protein [Candidatus Sericytochromatia bacterium]